ncbi:MAG: DUF2141 domain-containing protein [Hyphomonadaceae bacterium]
MNKSILLKSIAAAGAMLFAAYAPVEAQQVPVRHSVRVENVDAGAGPVRVAMFDHATWLSRAVSAGESEASANIVELTLSAPRAGRYGFAVYQDVNRDGRLNRNIVGLPMEPTAFSNGAVIRFGPPRFEAAAVSVSADSQTIVRLRS